MYPSLTEGEDNWMGRHVFTDGLMPASDILLWFQRDLKIKQRWRMFWMACADMFVYADDQEWLVAHYRFSCAS